MMFNINNMFSLVLINLDSDLIISLLLIAVLAAVFVVLIFLIKFIGNLTHLIEDVKDDLKSTMANVNKISENLHIVSGNVVDISDDVADFSANFNTKLNSSASAVAEAVEATADMVASVADLGNNLVGGAGKAFKLFKLADKSLTLSGLKKAFKVARFLGRGKKLAARIVKRR